jgi:hypothetical protein
MLKERTSYMKMVEGEIGDVTKDGRWVDVRETAEGGAVLNICADDLECLARINSLLGKDGKVIEAVVNEKGNEVIIVDEKGVQIPFNEMMSALFG